MISSEIVVENLTLPSTTQVRSVAEPELVVLLHGLARSHKSMRKLGGRLAREGYRVLNVGYPSTKASILSLSDIVIEKVLDHPDSRTSGRIHFVTHSMGGILVRSYLSRNRLNELGRVVMMGPPNKGSEVVDRIGKWWIFDKINGPAGHELGTAASSTPNTLGPVDFELGVIAGDRTINWINSLTMISGPDDGKVAVERTKVGGMKDHSTIHTTHTFMMRNETAISMTISFLRSGSFK